MSDTDSSEHLRREHDGQRRPPPQLQLQQKQPESGGAMAAGAASSGAQSRAKGSSSPSRDRRASSSRGTAPPIFFPAVCGLLLAVLLFYLGRLAFFPTCAPSPPPPSSITIPNQTYTPSPELPIIKMSNQEQTFIAVKPDGVQRGLVGNIISRFENRGFKLVAMKLTQPGQAHLEKHYEDLNTKPFFAGLIKYMNSGPICAMVWEGKDAVKTGRTILGATNPLASAPGTIRGDFALDMGRNVCHGSDSVENAKKEIALWFKPEELNQWNHHSAAWIFE
ncbi:hypothetical protein GE21DRAFT_8197 [Neurospora crassa]|nr:nucleoside diphosphate kinase [Neurospora crassa OR74A]ESA42670.1 nucleoside diphosphate kinase [Neurospora crassa OR74A]KHE86053.1 hypothetical protein GE21DRAFT_8197 [Neurospora crassa]|eukprot:XP_011394634.1 nucleoside diphosphate kinase [Neurospora crassa OR74A]